MSDTTVRIEPVSDRDLNRVQRPLAGLLTSCVEAGAGIGFVLPLSLAKAERFWAGQAGALESGSSHVWAAWQKEALVGTVTLALARQDNGGHRAEVAKLMVHPATRRQGIARLLLDRLEEKARTLGRTLLVLDTVTGGTAEGMYARFGYQRVGVIPDFAAGARGGFEATTVFYKRL